MYTNKKTMTVNVYFRLYDGKFDKVMKKKKKLNQKSQYLIHLNENNI